MWRDTHKKSHPIAGNTLSHKPKHPIPLRLAYTVNSRYNVYWLNVFLVITFFRSPFFHVYISLFLDSQYNVFFHITFSQYSVFVLDMSFFFPKKYFHKIHNSDTRVKSTDFNWIWLRQMLRSENPSLINNIITYQINCVCFLLLKYLQHTLAYI